MIKLHEVLEKEYAESKIKLEQYQHKVKRYENYIRYYAEEVQP